MQRVTSMLPSWDKTKTQSKKGFDKVWGWADKLGAPVNRLSNRIGSEAFWPTTLDKESDKAARILRSFCKDGFYAEEERTADQAGPKQKQKVLKKIPQKVIQNAVGLAIFTTMRTGLWVSGAGGSGVLVARKEDGTWSPPSGILLHTAGLGFLVGVDIYDCVLVINNRKALEAFTKIRATLGGEISAVAGPVGVGGVLENDGKWKQANRPVFTYLKSRGFYAGVQVDGTIVVERTDENERFYGERIGVNDILAGKARHPPPEIRMLMETLKAAEGSTDVDQELMEELEGQPAPGDVNVDAPSGKMFGIPEPDDPDPFGVLALEKEGLEIREAGTHSRPSSQQFEYNPSPTSPIYNKIHRRSIDTIGSRSNRESYISTISSRARWSQNLDRPYTTSEMGTQTDEVITPITSPTYDSFSHGKIAEEDEHDRNDEPPEVDYTKIDLGPYSNMNGHQDLEGTTVNGSPRSGMHHTSSMDNSFTSIDDDDEEPIVFEAASTQATVLRPQAIKARPGVVNIPARVPPPLPPRNTRRTKVQMVDEASGWSPIKPEFEDVELRGAERKESIESNDAHSFKSAAKSEKDDTEDDYTEAEEHKRKDSENDKVLINGAYSPPRGSSPAYEKEEGEKFHSVPGSPEAVMRA
ncbi:LAS seventeen-binding protein-like protein [Xylogone sp. PMI_703]|nr:LAS seventeen-binding protein-like protein [Xylogone sp. PMI_703]